MREPPDPEEFADALPAYESPGKTEGGHAHSDDPAMAAILKLLGRKYTIAILHHFSCEGSLRFTDLEEALDIPPNTLSDRLTELTESGFLTRQAYNEIPPRVEYQSTGKVRDLAPVFWYIGEWTERHDLGSTTSDGESG